MIKVINRALIWVFILSAGLLGVHSASADEGSALEEDNPQVLELITRYYEALDSEDRFLMARLVSPWDDLTYETLKESGKEGGHHGVKVWTQNAENAAFPVFVYYERDVEGQMVPSLGALYVVKNEIGELRIASADTEGKMKEEIEEAAGNPQVQELIRRVNEGLVRENETEETGLTVYEEAGETEFEETEEMVFEETEEEWLDSFTLTENTGEIRDVIVQYYEALDHEDDFMLSRIADPWDETVRERLMQNRLEGGHHNIRVWAGELPLNAYMVITYYEYEKDGEMVPQLVAQYMVYDEMGMLMVGTGEDAHQEIQKMLQLAIGSDQVQELIKKVQEE